MNTEISIGLFPEHLNGHQVLVADGREVVSVRESRIDAELRDEDC